MSEEPTTFADTINEGDVAFYKVTIIDETLAAIGSGRMDSLTLKFHNQSDGAIINNRDDLDALNANDTTVSAGGLITFALQPLDTAIIVASPSIVLKNAKGQPIEIHRATFKMVFDTTQTKNWDVDFQIRDLAGVT